MSKSVFEVPLSVSPKDLWDGMVTHAKGHCPFPEVIPEFYINVEGPWVQQGSVVSIKFNNHGLRDCKWVFTALDIDKRSAMWNWIDEDGPMAKRSHVISLVFVPTGDTYLVRFSIEFDGHVDAEYAETLKKALRQTMLLFSSRLNSIAQPQR